MLILYFYDSNVFFMSLLRGLLLVCFVLTPTSWAYNVVQPEFSLQRFLDSNPSQQPLMEQLSARVSSHPTPLATHESKTQKIAVVLSGQKGELKNKAWLMAFSRRMRELYLDFRIDVFYIAGNQKLQVTSDTFNNIARSAFDYVIVDGVNEYNRSSIEALLYRGQPKIILLGITAPVRAWRFHPPLIYIGIDLPKTIHRLASYINRTLDKEAIADLIMVNDAYENDQRCQVFINEWLALGRDIHKHFLIDNKAHMAFEIAQKRLQARDALTSDQHFIFSCTPEISYGVLNAIEGHKGVVTNAWTGQDLSDIELRQAHVLVTVLDMYDNMAITTAEAIKADVESRLLPSVYMESSRLLFQEMDEQTRRIMYQQAFRYSFPLWPH